MHLYHLIPFITLTAALPRIASPEAGLPLSEDELLPIASRPDFVPPSSQSDFVPVPITEFVDLRPRESRAFDFVRGCAMENKCLDADYGNLVNSDTAAADFCRKDQAALYDKINSCMESGCGAGESTKADFQEDLNKSCARAIEIAEKDDEKPTSTQTATKTASSSSSSSSSHTETSSKKAENTPSSTPTVTAETQETESASPLATAEVSKPVLSVGAIVGIAVGGVVLLALIALGLFLFLRRNRTHSRNISFEPTTPRPNSTSPPTKPTVTTTWHSTSSTATTPATPLRSTPTINTNIYPTISYTPASAPLSPVSPITPRESSELDTASTHSSPQFAPLSQRPVPQPQRSDTTVWRAKVEGARDRASRGVVMGEQSIAAEKEEGERERGGISGFVKRWSSGNSGNSASSELFGSSAPKKGPGFLGKRDSQGSEKRKSSGSKDGFVIM